MGLLSNKVAMRITPRRRRGKPHGFANGRERLTPAPV